MTFSEAQAYCQSEYGGYLPSSTSAEDNAIITELCEDIGQLQTACWLGLETPYTIFDDGQAVTYTDSWYTGEPDGYSSQPCTTIRGNGVWFTVGYCETDPLPFICEYQNCDTILATARARYTGDSYDEDTSIWTDITGNGRDVSVSGLPSSQIDQKSGRLYVQGLGDRTQVTFPADLLGDDAVTGIPWDYTLMHVCRYADESQVGRIFDAKTAFTTSVEDGSDISWLNTQSYWYSGFVAWGGKKYGVAQANFCQKTEWSDKSPDSWDLWLSVDQMNLYRGQGVDYTIDDCSPETITLPNSNLNAATQDQPWIVTINAGNRWGWERSSWGCAEIIAFDWKLDIEQIETVEQCLIEKYALDQTLSPTPAPVNPSNGM